MKSHDAQQELEYIKQVMKDSRTSIVDNGSGFILWGLLVGCIFILWYIVLVNELPWNINLIKLIVFGGMMIAFMAGPGFVIYNRFKTEVKKNVVLDAS